MPNMKALLQDINSSLGFHIPITRAKYLETIVPQDVDTLTEAILSLEGLDREDDVVRELRTKVANCLLAEYLQKASGNKPRKTLTLPRSKVAGR